VFPKTVHRRLLEELQCTLSTVSFTNKLIKLFIDKYFHCFWFYSSIKLCFLSLMKWIEFRLFRNICLYPLHVVWCLSISILRLLSLGSCLSSPFPKMLFLYLILKPTSGLISFGNIQKQGCLLSVYDKNIFAK